MIEYFFTYLNYTNLCKVGYKCGSRFSYPAKIKINSENMKKYENMRRVQSKEVILFRGNDQIERNVIT